MRIVHFSDAHIGVVNYGRTDVGTGLSARLADFLRSLDTIVDVAIESQADLVVFSGDAYKTCNPSPTYQREFASRILRLSQAGLPTVLVAGNHDTRNDRRFASSTEIFGILQIENVYVAGIPTVLDIETRHGPVQVGMLPWVVKSNLLARDKYKNLPLDQVNDLLLERIETILTGEQSLVSRLSPGMPHVLVAHGTIQGAVYGSERAVMLGHDIVLPLNLIKRQDWDYVAMGHLHRHQAIEPERDPPVVYAGSIERIDFGEEREDKGYVIAEVEHGQCEWTFHKLDVRPFVTIRVTADGDDPTAQVVQAIEQEQVDDTVVRLIIRSVGERKALIRQNEVKRALKDASYVASITHDVVRPERIRLGTQEDIASLTPIEMLERHLLAKETPPKRVAELKRHAELMIAGNT